MSAPDFTDERARPVLQTVDRLVGNLADGLPALQSIGDALAGLADDLGVARVVVAIDDPQLGRQVFCSARRPLGDGGVGLFGPAGAWTEPALTVDAVAAELLRRAIGVALTRAGAPSRPRRAESGSAEPPAAVVVAPVQPTAADVQTEAGSAEPQAMVVAAAEVEIAHETVASEATESGATESGATESGATESGATESEVTESEVTEAEAVNPAPPQAAAPATPGPGGALAPLTLAGTVASATARAVRHGWGFTLVLLRGGPGLTEALRPRVRAADSLVAISDHELALLFPETAGDRVPEVLNRLAAGGAVPPFSYGLACCPADSRDAVVLARIATERLAEAVRVRALG